jgi:hypothetical protein
VLGLVASCGCFCGLFSILSRGELVVVILKKSK